ncbi:MAG TPA: hypothetical protein LFW11_03950 [Rickettsia endosymbiont of Proechinophthirus fluctus]|uniref:hypothetical protein n=1 Tax=Rickettsia endosymbiont of Proechinophthirus fluctus TaxID=1462733 RepID=UPI000789DC17|nr:hypothetical protein [Rickettsia endosymbiont of Proechinophthirus fluctus]KYP98051.1 hypothetical protein BG75_03275 [Rickettsia endosymbiont of Proechinophthirus fluctus]HJD54493.1 hypothetical protein [Rickettsia endosymbiont of Proechinophthirus fluctus]
MWSLKSIKLFAEFFKDPLCRITDISFINALNNANKIDVLLDTLRVNETKISDLDISGIFFDNNVSA